VSRGFLSKVEPTCSNSRQIAQRWLFIYLFIVKIKKSRFFDSGNNFMKFVAIFLQINLFARHKQSQYAVSILGEQPPLPIYGPRNGGQPKWLASIWEQVANEFDFPQPRWSLFTKEESMEPIQTCGQGSLLGS
jgi:hypothetical protein